MEVIEDRAGLRSTIFTSQLPIAIWHEALGEPTLADAVMDRLLQNLHRIELGGESMRKEQPGPPADVANDEGKDVTEPDDTAAPQRQPPARRRQ